MRGEPLSWQSHFTSVQTESASVDPAALERAQTELGAELGMAEPFVLPELLAEMLGAGVSSCSRSVGGQDSEFGWLGTAMADMYRSYELETYMPHAVPIAFDGGGGFYLLDARGGQNDGGQPIVWSHTGSLSWDHGEYRLVARDFDSLVREENAF